MLNNPFAKRFRTWAFQLENVCKLDLYIYEERLKFFPKNPIHITQNWKSLQFSHYI